MSKLTCLILTCKNFTLFLYVCPNVNTLTTINSSRKLTNKLTNTNTYINHSPLFLTYVVLLLHAECVELEEYYLNNYVHFFLVKPFVTTLHSW